VVHLKNKGIQAFRRIQTPEKEKEQNKEKPKKKKPKPKSTQSLKPFFSCILFCKDTSSLQQTNKQHPPTPSAMQFSNMNPKL
jgi:hypothetical protein